ncbi:MAG: IgGFc-binding protein [Sandaracinaceae bacterium]
MHRTPAHALPFHGLGRRLLVGAVPLMGAVLLVAGCTTGGGPPDDAGLISPIQDGGFVCVREDAVACINNVHFSCEPDGEFLSPVFENCDDEDEVCVAELGCVICRPGEIFCSGNSVAECNDDGTDFEAIEECDVPNGFVCDLGECKNLCQIAVEERSYVGCEFYGADLDNASLGAGSDASAQQYSIVVSNPGNAPAEVTVEINRAAVGEEPDIEILETVEVLPGDLEVLDLPRREVDGSSSFAPCEASNQCLSGESCWCAGDITREDPEPTGGFRDCRCRNAAGASGFNDGTHSALSSHAFRVRSVLPIIAYQFNPLDNVGVFSNDASLLLPTSAISSTYTVIGWPQTIADSDIPAEDFDPGRDDEDLRSTLTIVGTAAGTQVTVTLGPRVREVVPIGDREPGLAGTMWQFDLGPFDVLNLETDGFNGDFTGTRVEATSPVSVFTGSEAADAPAFGTLANRSCCADHLEEQLFPDETLGRRFFIGRMPWRSTAVDDAIVTGQSIGRFDEPEYVRVLAVESGITTINTTLPPPEDIIELEGGGAVCITDDDVRLGGCGSLIIRTTRDFEMESDKSLAVLQTIASQFAVGIPSGYPGGDPAIVAIPPADQYRSEYVFLTPSLYAFDFITITAPRGTQMFLDEIDIEEWLRDGDCTRGPADGLERRMGDPPPEWEVYRCQFSFPDVVVNSSQGEIVNSRVEDGVQRDGYHTLRANEEVGIVVYGFDAFVSYAYAGGLNLDPLN